MFSEFLESNRVDILALTEEKTLKLAGALHSSIELKKGLPLFFELLVKYVKNQSEGGLRNKLSKRVQALARNSCD